MILREDKEENLLMLRNYRDEILMSNQIGKIYVDLLYKHSKEIAFLLLEDEDLRVQVRDIIEDFLPGVETSMEEKIMEIPSGMIMDMELLLEDVEVKASPGLKMDIRKVKREIKQGTIFRKLDITVK